jgi:hypothetical protein
MGKKLIYPKNFNRHSGEIKFAKKIMMSLEKSIEIGLHRLGN